MKPTGDRRLLARLVTLMYRELVTSALLPESQAKAQELIQEIGGRVVEKIRPRRRGPGLSDRRRTSLKTDRIFLETVVDSIAGSEHPYDLLLAMSYLA